MKYKVIVAETTTKLEQDVEELLRSGWKLQGGVSISITESDDYFYPYYAQALVKKS